MVHVQLKGMSKSQSSNVDCRCDGDEMSNRDQKGRTRPLDRVKEDVSQEYFSLSQQTYIPFVMKEAMSWVGWRNFNIQWCRGGLRVAEKVSSKRNQYPLTTIYG